METTKKIIKGIKILANGPLYCAVLVSAGAHCIGSKKKISIIESTPREEKLMLTSVMPDKVIPDEDDDLLEQPNVEQTCVVPTQPSNISQVALAGGQTTNQKCIPKENGGAKPSSRLDQSNQDVNSPSQTILDPLNEGTHDDNRVRKSALQVDNSQGGIQKNDSQQPSDSEGQVQPKTLPGQNLSPSLREFITKMDALKAEAKNLINKFHETQERSTCKKTEKIIKEANNFFDQKYGPDYGNLLFSINSLSKEDQKKRTDLVLKNAGMHIKALTDLQ